MAFRQLKQLKEDFPGKEWTLTGEFNFYDDGKSPKLDIALEGDLLKVLHDLIYYGSERELLQICVRVEVKSPNAGRSHYMDSNDDESDEETDVGVIQATKIKVDKEKNQAKRHFKYFQRQVLLPNAWSSRQTGWASFEHYKWTVSVDLDVSNLVDLSGLLNHVPGIFSKVLNQKLFTDFEFISNDGVSVPCHTAIISASSPMLMAKSQGKLDEPSKNQMVMDMSKSGTYALLQFIYGGEVKMPMINSNIALELFQASHQYGISDLEKVISEIFLQKQQEWWDIDVAFELFQFLHNYEGESCEELKNKVVHIVALKGDELTKSEMFKIILQKTPAVASQMFTLMASQLKNNLEEVDSD